MLFCTNLLLSETDISFQVPEVSPVLYITIRLPFSSNGEVNEIQYDVAPVVSSTLVVRIYLDSATATLFKETLSI